MTKFKEFVCDLCSTGCGKPRIFSRHSNLLRHRRLRHPGCAKLSLKEEPLQWFSCSVCESKYRSKRSLQNHQSKQHPDVYKKHKYAECKTVCPFGCDLKTSVRAEIIHHFEETHNLKIEEDKYRFKSYKEFDVWKEKVERVAKTIFVTRRTKFKGKITTNYFFMCYRSGFFLSEGKGIRQPRLKGTNKINGMCPAGLKVMEHNVTGVCEVLYCRTHVGHECFYNLSETLSEDLFTKHKMKETESKMPGSDSVGLRKKVKKMTKDPNLVLPCSTDDHFVKVAENAKEINTSEEDDLQMDDDSISSSPGNSESNVEEDLSKGITNKKCLSILRKCRKTTLVGRKSGLTDSENIQCKENHLSVEKLSKGIGLRKTFSSRKDQLSQTTCKTGTKSILADSEDNVVLIVEVSKADASKKQAVVFKSNQTERKSNSKYVQVDTEENIVIGETQEVIGSRGQFSAFVRNRVKAVPPKSGPEDESLEKIKHHILEDFKKVLSSITKMEEVHLVNELLDKMKSAIPTASEVTLVSFMTLDSHRISDRDSNLLEGS